jgi:hypothetical protein
MNSDKETCKLLSKLDNLNKITTTEIEAIIENVLIKEQLSNCKCFGESKNYLSLTLKN